MSSYFGAKKTEKSYKVELSYVRPLSLLWVSIYANRGGVIWMREIILDSFLHDQQWKLGTFIDLY